jgi:hypothetical protein
LQIQTRRGPFVYCVILSFIKSIVVFGSWLGSYHKYCTYLAISHTNVEIPIELSELTGLRLKQIMSGQKTVVQSTSMQIDSFWLLLDLGSVYLATEGINSLARLTES